MRLAQLSLVLALPLALASPASAGAPTLCVPFDIGAAASLPLAKDGHGRSSLPVESVVERTIALLDASDATLVHMETIRRAVLTLSGEKGWWPASSSEAARAPARELVRLLRARVAAAEQALERRPAVEGLAWFDLGYALSTFEDAGLRLEEGNVAALQRAAGLRPEDGAVQLGLALASWTKEGSQALRRQAFRRAAELSHDPDSLLRTNLMVFAARFLEARTYDELLAKVRA